MCLFARPFELSAQLRIACSSQDTAFIAVCRATAARIYSLGRGIPGFYMRSSFAIYLHQLQNEQLASSNPVGRPRHGIFKSFRCRSTAPASESASVILLPALTSIEVHTLLGPYLEGSLWVATEPLYCRCYYFGRLHHVELERGRIRFLTRDPHGPIICIC